MINLFLESKPQQVFALLGQAGSGKSIGLQKLFVESVINWNKSDPVPIYFNLANSHLIKKQWDQSGFKLSFNQIA